MKKIKIYIKDLIIDILQYVIIYLTVTISWQMLEVYMTGNINPNNVDSVIATVLSLSIHANIKLLKKKLINKCL